MADPIRALAEFLSLKKTKSTDQKFVLMLGAGASLTSGVKTTATIMEEVVQKFGASTAASTEERFDELWRNANRDSRRDMLQPYLVDGRPSEGYRHLADLIVRGFFDVVITFNFDRLLERALEDANFRDYKVIIRGETIAEELERLVDANEPRVKILKLHGSLQSSDYFLFSSLEMLNYPEHIRALLWKLTGRDIVMCGYGFNDRCVERAFNDSEDSGDVYYVNPSGAGQGIRPYLIRRRSKDRVVSGELGRFDNFFRALHSALTTPVLPIAARQRQNLFKFLDYYQEDQKAWFFGRRRLTRILVEQFETAPPPVLFLYGEPKVGKTSFIRAGLIPNLSADRFEIIYVRGKRDLEAHLRAQLVSRYGPTWADAGWEDIGTHITQSTTKHVVLVIDQLEKFVRAWEDPRENQAAMLRFITTVFAQSGPRLSIVGVSVDEVPFYHLLAKLPPPAREAPQMAIPPLSAAVKASIVRHAARVSGTPVSPTLLQDICNDKGLATLTHVQTVCYYMAKGYYSSWQGYERVTDQGLVAALDSISADASLIDLIDDLPDQERRLIRAFLKVICEPTGNTRKIVEFIRKHFPDIKDDRFPEPLE